MNIDARREQIEARAKELGHAVVETAWNSLQCIRQDGSVAAEFGYSPKLMFLDFENLRDAFPRAQIICAR